MVWPNRVKVLIFWFGLAGLAVSLWPSGLAACSFAVCLLQEGAAKKKHNNPLVVCKSEIWCCCCYCYQYQHVASKSELQTQNFNGTQRPLKNEAPSRRPRPSVKVLSRAAGPKDHCQVATTISRATLAQPDADGHWFPASWTGCKKTPAQKKIMSTNAVPQNINHDGWHKWLCFMWSPPWHVRTCQDVYLDIHIHIWHIQHILHIFNIFNIYINYSCHSQS